MTFQPLSPLEARVLGVLVEKQRSVPDTYPLSLNALVAGCNQKTSRAPIMDVAEADVLQALDGLNARSLIVESSGGRVMRYAHNAERVLDLPTQSVALLATLALRGPQTAAELRSNSERLHRFADVSTVEAFLHELAERASGPLVAELARMPGTRETRWMQLLTGAAAEPAPPREATTAVAAPTELANLAARIDALTRDVESLKEAVAAIAADRRDPAPSAE
ncbi:MAG TPA: YceH family protein [Casimicrobiaceae bacterium]|jgi:hypothetical protein|nr:YceH family protein [Casimicrobiaceae bacterium]